VLLHLTTTSDGLFSDTVYDAQGCVAWTDDPHLAGKPADGTHTQYDPNGHVTGTQRWSNLVITIHNPTTNPTSVVTSTGAVLSTSSTTYDAAGRRRNGDVETGNSVTWPEAYGHLASEVRAVVHRPFLE
jgi:hypothetical protein